MAIGDHNISPFQETLQQFIRIACYLTKHFFLIAYLPVPNTQTTQQSNAVMVNFILMSNATE